MYTEGLKAVGIFAGTEISSAVVQKCSGSQQRQLGQRALTNKPLLLQCPPTPRSSPLPGGSQAAPHTGTQTRSTTGLSCSECTSAGLRAPHCLQTHQGFFSKRESSCVTPSGVGCSITHESVAASLSIMFRVTLEEIIVRDGYISAGKESRDLLYT